ncbi:hypothetical protein HELRODRAFT_169631 [Helobdella robusta]|uniref:Uncharacterized protein n=1 Tax=Helobdella robusta TaxID=6412 RepID=T1F268_HELRO|nr:hypothetical protein HELRODRAFT_169631 [Helobdella robusta]ESO07925.1 hypothetical protein HELRODRAFT_169631 [Helobdella robusta]
MRFYPPRSRGAANLIFISLTLPGILLSTILTLTDALEDVGQKRFSFSGTIRSDAKAGDEVQLNSSIASYYSKILLSSLTNKHHKVKICGYTVYRDPYMLFKVNPESTATGSAKIVLTKDIKSENFKWNYTFEIAPHTCESGRHLERRKMYA